MSQPELNHRLLDPQFSTELMAEMKACRRTWGTGFPVISDALLLPHLIELQRRTIERFCEAVEREAEGNMLKTGKLEGAHYAAMRRLRGEIRKKAFTDPALCSTGNKLPVSEGSKSGEKPHACDFIPPRP